MFISCYVVSSTTGPKDDNNICHQQMPSLSFYFARTVIHYIVLKHKLVCDL